MPVAAWGRESHASAILLHYLPISCHSGHLCATLQNYSAARPVEPWDTTTGKSHSSLGGSAVKPLQPSAVLGGQGAAHALWLTQKQAPLKGLVWVEAGLLLC